ncbi:MAG: DUF418 domain-containing protein [Phycisphaerales bacterium JB039]
MAADESVSAERQEPPPAPGAPSGGDPGPAPEAGASPGAGAIDDPVRAAPQAARFVSLDVLRGFALLGILAMNVMTFAMPFAAYQNPTAYPEDYDANIWTYRIVHIVFDLKMMALFSMLFGAGVVIWARKPQEISRPGSLRWLWLRRMGWLLAIGMVHAWLIWEGDILVAYAICGMVVLWWLRRLAPVWLVVIGAALFVVHLLLNFGNGWWTTQLFAESSPVAASMPAEQLAEARDGIRAWMDPTPEQLAEQLAALDGDWRTVFEHRAENVLWIQLQGIPFFLFWRCSALMLLGAALTKWGVFTGERSARFYIAMAALGYAIGLPLVIAGLRYNETHGFEMISYLTVGGWFNTIGSVPVALGHAGLLLLIVKLGLLRGLCFGLARVGQMAFTNYLMQSILCSLIFYGWGLGLAGDVSRLQQELVVLGIWIVQIAWSVWWLRRFRFGPAEWLWRSLTYWKPQPMRRPGAPS